MKFIKKIKSEIKGKYITSMGLFLCPYCNNKVKKRKSDGIKCKSCGCMHGEAISENQTKHGCAYRGSKNRLYTIWNNMKSRCYYNNNDDYKNYGGRGISVCNIWKEYYIMFQVWALLHGYKEGLTIDRINNDGNYEPSNCKFSTAKEQAHNRRNNKLTMKKANQIRSLYFNIKITKTLLGKIFNVSRTNISSIINNKSWIN